MAMGVPQICAGQRGQIALERLLRKRYRGRVIRSAMMRQLIYGRRRWGYLAKRKLKELTRHEASSLRAVGFEVPIDF